MNNKKQSVREEEQLARLMEDYAVDDGEQLWKEYEAAVNAGNAETVSDALDNCLRRQMNRRLEERKSAWGKFFGAASRVAVCAMLLVLTSAAILNVNADTDIHVDRFLQKACSMSELQNRYLIHMRRYPAREVQDVEAIRRIMAGLTEKGYALQQEYTNHNATEERGAMGLYSIYRNEQGQKVELNCRIPISGLIVIHKEEGLYATQIQCVGYDMVLVEQGSMRKIFWLDDAEGLCYSLYVEGLSESNFWDLIYALAQA